jgi:UDP-N-acetylmuramoylalanine--D-glutamate ligase
MTELREFFLNKKVLVLGFGLEGKSTLELLRGIPCEISVADKNPDAVAGLPYKLYTGEDYLAGLSNYDIIMKSPGISFKGLEIPHEIRQKITCQTDLLLRFRQNRIVGITGTKGKSTVSSLIYHILTACGKDAALIGNIGVPPLEQQFSPQTILVCEMSCHQLEFVQASPDVAVFLNLFEEHLDHYNSFADYRAAKENIFRFQKESDVLIRGDAEDAESARLRALPNPARVKLRGEHNLGNIAVALRVCALFGCDEAQAVEAAEGFAGLPHRLELFAVVNGVEYINDSISTIPQAAISAVLAYPGTDTLIIGGMDRGINYAELVDFLPKSGIINLIALPDSGHKVAEMLPDCGLDVYRARDMQDAVKRAVSVTKRRCILSPAAASYGFYKNFEERGSDFKSLVNNIKEN